MITLVNTVLTVSLQFTGTAWSDTSQCYQFWRVPSYSTSLRRVSLLFDRAQGRGCYWSVSYCCLRQYQAGYHATDFSSCRVEL